MRFKNLGNSPIEVSVVGLGTNNFGLRNDVDSEAVVAAALDAGINFFDTAESYGAGLSEQALGAALKGRRSSAVIGTKWGGTRNPPPRFGSREYILAACDRSLTRLQTDWIDLYQLHAPDPTVPLEETMAACAELVRQGKVRHIGLSNSPAEHIVAAHHAADAVGLELVSAQDHYSVLKRDIVEGARLKAIDEAGLSLLPFYPLASGLLSGKYKTGDAAPEGSRMAVLGPLIAQFLNDRNWAIVAGLEEFATSRGHSIIELAFSWLAVQPAVASVMAGATKVSQVLSNAAAADWPLTAAELAEIDTIVAGEGGI